MVEDNVAKKQCFVITPIGDATSPIRRHADGIIKAVIEPVLKENGYELIIPHEINASGSISKNIIENLYTAELVIANLTGLNPNVMYELAVRHTLGKKAIIIAEDGTKLPFDISDQRTIFYINDAKGTVELKGILQEKLGTIEAEEIVNNLVTETLKDKKTLDYLLVETNNGKKSDKSDFLENYLVKSMQDINRKLENMSLNIQNRSLNAQRIGNTTVELCILDDEDIRSLELGPKVRYSPLINDWILSGRIASLSFDDQTKCLQIEFIGDVSRQIMQRIKMELQKIYSNETNKDVEIRMRVI